MPPATTEPAVRARAAARARRGAAGTVLLSLLIVGGALSWLATDLRRPVREAAVSPIAEGVPARSPALRAPAEGGQPGRIQPVGSAGPPTTLGTEDRDGPFPRARAGLAPRARDTRGLLLPAPQRALLTPLDRREWRLANPPTGPPLAA